MKSSSDISLLAEDLYKLQAEMPFVRMNSKNPFFNSKYADLGAVIETSKPLLEKYNFSMLQLPTSKIENGISHVGVTTILLHKSGQFIEETILLPITEEQEENEDQKKKKKTANYPQKAGIAITYLRRYAWAAILGMYSEEDTDGTTSGNNGYGLSVSEISEYKNKIKSIMADNKDKEENYKELFGRFGNPNKMNQRKQFENLLSEMKKL